MNINFKQIKYNITPISNRVIEYIVIHDTGNVNKGANAEMHFKYFDGDNRNASADFFVDDNQILQVNDYNKYYTWHCGDGNGKYGITNKNSIGIEMCINSDGNFNKTLDNTVQLVKDLKKIFLNAKVVRHYDASRKNCPEKLNYNNWQGWSEFLMKVNDSTEKQTGYFTMRMYDSNIHVYVTNKDEDVDVTLGKQGQLEKLSDISDSNKAITAKINGGFFNFDGSKEHLGLYLDECKIVNNVDNTFITFTYYKSGTTKIHYITNSEEIFYLTRESNWSIGTGWSLVKEGKIDLTNANLFDHSSQKHPRTLLGQRKNGSFVFVVVEGRTSNSLGVNAQQSAEIMLKLDCWNAVNLDGGGSSEMIVNNQIKNVLTDGSERKIGSAIIAYNKNGVIENTILKTGSTGQQVSELQNNLNKLGYNLVVDGIFGKNTENAVKDFQSKNNLVFDGIVGDKTKEAIKQALESNLPFKDWNSVSDYAKASVEKMKKLSIMVGDSNGNFNPKQSITREDLAVVIDKLLSER